MYFKFKTINACRISILDINFFKWPIYYTWKGELKCIGLLCEDYSGLRDKSI